MPGSIRSMQLEHVLRDVQTDRGSLLHGRLLRWQFDTVTLARRCRRGASTPSPVSCYEVEDFHTGLGANECQPLRRRAVGVELAIRVASVGGSDNRSVVRDGL